MTGGEDKLERLSVYLDGELPDAEARQLERQIADDPALADELRRLRAVRGLVGQLPRHGAPEGFPDRVLDRAERRSLTALWGQAEQGGPSRGLARLAIAAVALIAAGVAVVMVSSVLWTGTSGREKPRVGVGGPASVSPGRGAGRATQPSWGAPAGAEAGRPARAKGLWGGDPILAGLLGEDLADKHDDADKWRDLPELLVVGDSSNVSIWARDLPAARREVENALVVNGVRPERFAKDTSEESGKAAGANSYRVRQIARGQWQLDANLTVEQRTNVDAVLVAMQTARRRGRRLKQHRPAGKEGPARQNGAAGEQVAQADEIQAELGKSPAGSAGRSKGPPRPAAMPGPAEPGAKPKPKAGLPRRPVERPVAPATSPATKPEHEHDKAQGTNSFGKLLASMDRATNMARQAKVARNVATLALHTAGSQRAATAPRHAGQRLATTARQRLHKRAEEKLRPLVIMFNKLPEDVRRLRAELLKAVSQSAERTVNRAK